MTGETELGLRRVGRRSWGVVCAAVLSLTSVSASGLAAGRTIVLVRPPTDDALRSEAFFRLSGELTQQGFRIVVRDADGELGPRDLRGIADEENAVAAVSLGGELPLPEADVWIVDRATGKTTLRTIATDRSGDAPARLALRAGELLRLSLSELDVRESTPDVVGADPEVIDEPLRRYAATPPSDERVRFWLGVGAALVTSDGWGVMAGPRFGLHVRFDAPFELGLTFTGPRGSSAFAVETARADLTHEQLTIEPRWLLPFGTRWSLALAPALGVGHFGVRGSATSPWRPLDASTWTFLLGGRAAVRFDLLRHLRLSVAADVDVSMPSVEVEVAENVRRLGPLWGGGATLEVGF